MPPILSRPLLPSLLFCLPAVPAWAADLPGSVAAGLTGPLVQLVHLLGLLALGLWASRQGEAGRLVAVALAAGLLFALLQQGGVRLPYVHLVLEGTLVVFGGMTALAMTLPAVLGLVLAAIGGAVHGWVLAAWAGVPSRPLLFWPGLLAGGALLLSAGVGAGALIQGLASDRAVRLSAAAIALVGLLMLAGLV